MGSISERNTVVSDFIKYGSLPDDWNAEEQVGLLSKMTSENAIDRPTAAELLQLI
ncbi:hypothetical protein A2U01_0030885, partial [Trifolium medium]|nr:hypothetical protein [Trifolium medium]